MSHKSLKPETIAVAAGRMSAEHFGTVNTPVYRTSTILHESYASLKDETNARYNYGRIGTPSTESFEHAVAELEGAARTVSVPAPLPVPVAATPGPNLPGSARH